MLGLGLGITRGLRPLGGFVGLLDLFPNAAAALALRLLRKNYSGGLARVRAWDGVANQGEAEIMPRRIDAQNYVVDLNSKLEDLDATAISRGLTTNDTLADLVLSGTSNYDGLVSGWRDQSLSNDATQTTATNQPKIVSAGSLVTENGKAAIDFDGVNDYMVSNSAYPTQTTETHFYVASSTGSNNRVLDTRGTGGPGVVKGWHHKFSNAGSGDASTIDDGAGAFIQSQGIVRTGQKLVSVSFSTTAITEYTNGVLSDNDSGSVTDFDSGNNLYIGANVNGANSQLFGGTMQIIVLYNSDQSANRTAIETNINNFYTIYP